MKNLIILCIVFFLGIGNTLQAGEPELKKIFNGKDFKGWQVPENNIWWTINDGILKTSNDPKKTASTLWTTKDYEDFIIQLDFLFGEGTVDSGIFLRDMRTNKYKLASRANTKEI